MVSDLNYYLRVKGEKTWQEWGDHPCRPLEGIVSLWADFNKIPRGTIIEFTSSPGEKVIEVVYGTKPKQEGQK